MLNASSITNLIYYHATPLIFKAFLQAHDPTLIPRRPERAPSAYYKQREHANQPNLRNSHIHLNSKDLEYYVPYDAS